jgi:hypothetical protein
MFDKQAWIRMQDILDEDDTMGMPRGMEKVV